MTTHPTSPSDLVWHYTDAAGLLAILGSHTLWATSSAFLNDRQEVRLGGDLLYRQVRRLAEGADDSWSEMLAERMAEARKEGDLPTSSTYFILSASQSGDSLAMWRLYGGARESYAIGLDPDAPLGVLATGGESSTAWHEPSDLTMTENRELVRRMTWKPVRYQPDEQQQLVDTVVEQIPGRLAALRDHRPGDSHDPEHLPAQVGAMLNTLTEAMLLIKHEGFVDERETRLSIVLWTAPGAAAGSNLLRYRATAHGIAPYFAVTGMPDHSDLVTTQASPLPIKAVSVSPSPNGQEAESSVRHLLASHGYADVPVLRSAIPFRAG